MEYTSLLCISCSLMTGEGRGAGIGGTGRINEQELTARVVLVGDGGGGEEGGWGLIET